MSNSTAFGGARTTLLGQLAKFAIQVSGLVILARLLTPEEYGLYGMVLVFTGIGALIGDFGLASASIQAKAISRQQRSNLFWVNLALGAGTTGGFVLLATPLSAVYGDGRISALIMVAAFAFVVQGAYTQFAANATRELRFGLLATSDVVSQFLGLLAAVIGAVAGLGVWALVIQQLCIAVTMLLMLTITSRWAPGWPRRAPMRELLIFGANTFGVQVLNFFTAKVDSFVIGKFLGPAPLGIYDRGYQLNQIPTQQLATPLTRVALPLLSRYQDDVPILQDRVRELARVLAYVLGIGILFVGANADSVVAIVLGSQWTGVAPILTILSVGGFFQAMGYQYYWTFLALGKTGVQLRFALIMRPVMVVLIVAGLPFGVFGVAAGVTAGLVANWAVLSIFALRKVGVRPAPLAAPVLRALLVGVVSCGAGALLIGAALGDAPSVVQLIVSVTAALAVGAVFIVLPPFRTDLIAIRRLIERRGND